MSEPGLHVPGAPQPESRFIEATALCPHPGRWSSTDGDSTEIEVAQLVASFATALQPDLVVETGSGFGQTTLALACALRANGRGSLVSLEVDAERAAGVRAALAGAGLGADVLEISSLEWEPACPIDLLFSDSFYELRVPEFLRFRRWMRPGSLAVFHDTAPGRGAHRLPDGRDLRSWLESLDLPIVHLPTPRGLSLVTVE